MVYGSRRVCGEKYRAVSRAVKHAYSDVEIVIEFAARAKCINMEVDFGLVKLTFIGFKWVGWKSSVVNCVFFNDGENLSKD